MCQLILPNLNDNTLNKIILCNLIQIDAASGNRDGTGILVTDKGGCNVWKTKASGDNILNLGVLLKKLVVGRRPIIGHVRAASKGIDVKDANAHPFKGERFVLAHNGRLYDKDEKVTWGSNADDSISSDSLKFLHALEKEVKKNPNLTAPEALRSAMEKFKGKFAFLIYDSLTDTYYAVRGDTAELHVAYINMELEDKSSKRIGFIVNTKKTALTDAIQLSIPIFQMITGNYYSLDKVEELKRETIYKVEKTELADLGGIKENNVVYYSQSSYDTSGRGNAGNFTYSSATNEDLAIPIWRRSNRVLDFMDSHFLNIQDIDCLFRIFLKVNMADANSEDIANFVDSVIPKISANKKIKKKIYSKFGEGFKVHPYLYEKLPDFEYPWMLNNEKKIDEMIEYIMKVRQGLNI